MEAFPVSTKLNSTNVAAIPLRFKQNGFKNSIKLQRRGRYEHDTICFSNIKLGSYVNVNTSELKSLLIKKTSGTNRGKLASPFLKSEILGIIKEVESRNLTVRPTESPLLSGVWALIYTAPVDEEVADKYAGTEEGPFLSRLKPFSFGIVKPKGSTQIIDAENGEVQNIASFVVLGIPGTLNIRGSCNRVGSEYIRLDVEFKSFELKLGNNEWVVPLSWVKPTGWVDTTYLDEELRIGRGDKGSVFVTVRRK